ncbi:YbeD family protein [Chitinasiproducens palmae]|uniref:UPF0250 protein SAMN05216551_10521 n=1 Tax=Chitinasiproducens palmae TaxID=1770053 RepID=A0A1H2PPU7_9BURK|nr:DUF493 family protein [Chitinasiproducens palmae]SDV48356.1 hypothetical protein SAMN05216551_10521 [Chitinasiproducens palmae]
MTTANDKDEIFAFPCDFPIKVMGRSTPEFTREIGALVAERDPAFKPETIEVRASSSGNYTGLTVVVHAQSRAHLDDIYRALTAHPDAKYVL